MQAGSEIIPVEPDLGNASEGREFVVILTLPGIDSREGFILMRLAENKRSDV